MVLIAVAGDLDMLTTPLLDDAIHAALRKQPTAMIVDLTGVVFLAAAAMNLLVATHHEITPTPIRRRRQWPGHQSADEDTRRRQRHCPLPNPR